MVVGIAVDATKIVLLILILFELKKMNKSN
ncbi:hypothetical protein ERIN107935_09115 [Erysipelothrix inopinata]